jgi:hypothetical protein
MYSVKYSIKEIDNYAICNRSLFRFTAVGAQPCLGSWSSIISRTGRCQNVSKCKAFTTWGIGMENQYSDAYRNAYECALAYDPAWGGFVPNSGRPLFR